MSLFGSAGIGGILSGLTKDAKAATDNAGAQKSDVSFKDTMTAAEKFLKYQEMTPAQKIRASYLAAHGLTEEDLAAMPPEERKKIEEAIVEELKRKLGGKEIHKGNIG